MQVNGEIRSKIADLRCCVIIPTYNNEKTLEGVIREVQLYTENIIVVNDGSNDSTSEILKNIPGILTTTSDKNRGKGRALQKGFAKAYENNFRYAITIDSDGQHRPADIPKFIDLLEREPGSLILGARDMVRPFMFAKGLKKKSVKGFIKEYVLDSNDSNSRVTLSVMLGVFVGVLPVWGWQMMIAFGLAHYFKLNKFVTVAASNISIPPILPLILYLSYEAGGLVMGFNKGPVYSSGFDYQWLKVNFVQYLLGSVIFGIILSLTLSSITYLLLQIFRKPKSS